MNGEREKKIKKPVREEGEEMGNRAKKMRVKRNGFGSGREGKGEEKVMK